VIRGILYSAANDSDVVEPQFGNLLRKPVSAPLHGLNESKGDVGSSQSKHETRKSCARTHVTHKTPLGEHVGEYSTVQDVSGPQTWRLEWADKAPLLAKLRQIARKSAGEFDVLTKDSLRYGRLGLNLDGQCFT
jgi:hypothetical protein